MEILVDSRQTRISIDNSDLRKTAVRILEGLGCDDETVLSVLFVDAAEMAELNQTYRGKSGPTNVLSFSQQEGLRTPGRNDLLGDVVICTDRAADDAEELGYTQQEMVLYLLIHGILHLVGFAHDTPQDEQDMQSRVDSIFEGLIRQPDQDRQDR